MLKKYYQKRMNGIESLTGRSSSHFTVEDFHKLRVELKKINALFSLMAFCQDNFKRKKIFSPFKKIFDQAGKVRELQLEIAMLKKHKAYFSNNIYINRLILKLGAEKKKFFSMLENKKSFSKTGNKIIPVLKKVNKKCVLAYLSGRRNKIESILQSKNLKANRIHELRKRLKVIFYIIKSVDAITPAGSIKQSGSFLVLLGKWHDHRIAIDYLKKIIKTGKLEPVEFKLVEKTKADVSAQLAKLYLKINIQRKTVPPLKIFGFK